MLTILEAKKFLINSTKIINCTLYINISENEIEFIKFKFKKQRER
jgi:hypothetical protein